MDINNKFKNTKSKLIYNYDFEVVAANTLNDTSTIKECISFNVYNSIGYLKIKILKSRLTTSDLDGFKTYLSNHNLKVRFYY